MVNAAANDPPNCDIFHGVANLVTADVAGASVPAYLGSTGVWTGRERVLRASIATNRSPLLVLLSAIFVLLIAATLGLWGYYGSVVFFEAIRAGIAACF
jgi:hypothetical protein